MNNINMDDLLNIVKSYNKEEVERVRYAYYLAYNLHKGQYRQSGEEYIIHPLNVAYILALLHADGDTLCAGLLHDTLEDTSITKEDLEEYFNITVANLVDGVTKFKKSDFNNKYDENAANTRKIINGVIEDARIIIIKLADRLHNMRTLEFKSKEKQKENALETMDIFVPLAYYLGVNNIKSELEDLSFKYLLEDEYNKAKDIREELVSDFTPYLNEMIYKINELLNNKDIPNDIKIRIKNIYGVYRRLIRKNSDSHDLIALKVMVDNIDNCYKGIGVIHSIYHPINNKFKDYICNPKNNMYQSLHTTVLSNNGRPTQIQIRTHEMDMIATYGLPYYWEKYHNTGKEMMWNKISENKTLFDNIIEMNEMYNNDGIFVNEVKKELFASKIEVYTRKGDIITLPVGSTPIDFAYKIHTEVGNTMIKAIVNGEEVPFSYKLQDKDRVVIITDELVESPSSDLLKYANTSHARRKIKEKIRG